MPAASNSKALMNLLVLLEAAEKTPDDDLHVALERLACLHEEAKAEVEDPTPQIGSDHPIGVMIFLAMMKNRDEALQSARLEDEQSRTV